MMCHHDVRGRDTTRSRRQLEVSLTCVSSMQFELNITWRNLAAPPKADEEPGLASPGASRLAMSEQRDECVLPWHSSRCSDMASPPRFVCRSYHSQHSGDPRLCLPPHTHPLTTSTPQLANACLSIRIPSCRLMPVARWLKKLVARLDELIVVLP